MTSGMFTPRPHGTYISRIAFRTVYTLRSGALFLHLLRLFRKGKNLSQIFSRTDFAIRF